MSTQEGRKNKGVYTEQFISLVLASLEANQGNVNRVARQFNIHRKLVIKWREQARDGSYADNRRISAAVDMLPQVRQELADRLESFIHEGLNAAPSKIDSANLQQLFIAIGISLDKMQLLRGRPTNISRSESAKVEVNESAAREAMAVLQKRGLLN